MLKKINDCDNIMMHNNTEVLGIFQQCGEMCLLGSNHGKY